MPQKCESLQIDPTQKGLGLIVVAQPHLRLGMWACIATSNIKRRQWVSAESVLHPYPERANDFKYLLTRRGYAQSCCLAYTAHGTALTGTERMGMWACTATSNINHSQWVSAEVLLHLCPESANSSNSYHTERARLDCYFLASTASH